MSIERSLFLLAAVMVLISTLLAMYVNSNWSWFTLFVGFNMIQSTFTGFCPPKWLFKKLGMKTEAELAQ
ncbi:MAG: DUF2892 domain-containing protein [Gammaproteobacteria bacterium]|nr:DUF2892 domain-containing protein [Gammaproteobacteria bacterium]